MEQRKKRLASLAAAALAVLAVAGHYALDPWGFYWKVSTPEADTRLSLVKTAEKYLGYKEADESHRMIIDRYNEQDPLPMGYEVQYTDSWCSTFVSAMALESGLSQIIPTECGCQRHISLFQDMGRWVEDDTYIPLPGDLIFYDWDQTKPGDATGWSDHVGIVVGTKWPFVKVIEGNKDDCVDYRIILLGDIRIRGYGVPDYTTFVSES